MSALQSPKILQLYPGLVPIPELEPNFYDPVSNVEWSEIQDGDFPSDPKWAFKDERACQTHPERWLKNPSQPQEPFIEYLYLNHLASP